MIALRIFDNDQLNNKNCEKQNLDELYEELFMNKLGGNFVGILIRSKWVNI
jgi:hypothetical protein